MWYFLEVIRFRYGLEDGASMIELVFYKKRKRDHDSLFFSTMWLHSEKAVVWKPTRSLPGTNISAPWSWTYRPPECEK